MRNKNLTLNNFKYAILCTIVGAIFSIVSTIKQVDSINGQKTYDFNLYSVLSTSAAGLIIGLCFSLIQTYDDRVKHYEEKLNIDKEELHNILKNLKENLIINQDLFGRIESSFDYYRNIQNLLRSNEADRELIKIFLGKIINEPSFITRQSSVDFYRLLILGLENCNVWRGIHQGSIKKLGFDHLGEPGENYFEILKASENKNKKRIIILTKDEQQELKNKQIMLAFWNKTGKYVPSYWISHENFYGFTHLNSNIEVDDCALHNGRVLLHYHRNYHRSSDPNIPEGLIMIDFAGSKSLVWNAIKNIIDELEKPNPAISFTEIKQEDIDRLPDLL